MKKKKLFKLICALIAAGAGIAIGASVLNKKEAKNKEFSNNTTNRFLGSKATFYERYVKRAFDITLASVGILVSAPIVAVASLLIFIEDPGNVIFKQKRVGINKSYFEIHKLRSMKKNIGDVPTHLLSKEEQDKLILKVGKLIRKTSIDEIPQCIDIIRGRMSLVGPRPALWNQEDLIAERDRYGANDVRPGLTGWAQINGRDELPISVKARYDGEYTKALRKSSISGFKMDCRCLFGTIKAVICSEGVVEGGTGSLTNKSFESLRHYSDGKSNKELIGNIGFSEKVEIDANAKKKVLITGEGSYIGRAFMDYAGYYYKENFTIKELNMLEESWKEEDFSQYDIVYHVAGIAHADIGNVDEKTKQNYYRVNTDLAVETAKKSKAAGVKEFIFMSSMIVYGDSAPIGEKKIVRKNTVPSPSNFYGDSKLQADMAVRDLADDSFKVIVLRPPMIYGRNSKGNYPVLSKFAKKLPVFPYVKNERSMLYIGNLCEMLCEIMLMKEPAQNSTVLIPQNSEWTNTSDMVKKIAEVNGKKIRIVEGLGKVVKLGSKFPGKIGGLANKAFGNMCYSHAMSVYDGIDYQKASLDESIFKTENREETEKAESLE